MVIPDRRTLVVLAALIVGMTLTSGLLLILEPGPVEPLPGVTLQSIDRSDAPEERLFDTPTPLGWQAIVIHDSGSEYGSSESLNRVDEALGKGGLGYHFVVNNGSEERDGLIEVGFRWQRQYIGAYLNGPGSMWFNRHAIGICLIGNGDKQAFTEAQLRELVWLVQRLQKHFGISREAVYLQIGPGGEAGGSGPHFPDAWFRQQLLTVSAPE